MRYLPIILLLVLLAACSQPVSTPEPIQPPIASEAIGLKGTYFSRADFSGAQVSRIDRYVYFDWGKIAPTRDFAPGAFSARWEGEVQIDVADTYTFIVTSSGKTTLRLDHQVVSGPIKLEKGRHFLQLEFIKTAAEAAVKLEWKNSQLAQGLVPQEKLYPVKLENQLSTQAVPIGINLLLNSNFEGGTGGWLKYGGVYSITTPGANNTGSALSAAEWAWIQQDLAVSDIEVGQTYTLKASSKALNGNTCTVGVAGGAAGQVAFRKSVSFQSANYQEQGVSLSVPAGTVWMSVYMATDNQTCHFDNLSLIAGDTAPPPPPVNPTLILNGSFENDFSNWGQFGGTSVISSVAQEGSKAAELSNFAWVQQNIAGSLLEPGKTYKLSSYAKAATGQTCTLGFVAATPTQTLFAETLTFTETIYTQKSITQTISAEVSWAAVYIASGIGSCNFDAISLVDPNAVVNGTGTGLRAEYFDDLNYNGTFLTRLDSTINFDWGAGAPAVSMGIDTFSARWTGEIQPRYSGAYTFYTTTDDGVRLWINDQLVIDNWTLHSSTVNQGIITLSANQKYAVYLEYFENAGSALIKLEWSSTQQTREVVPATQLYPATVPTAPTIESQKGKWSGVFAWPLIATHMANLPDGRVLSWSSYDETTFGGRPDLQYSEATIYNPATNTFQDADNPQHDMFCAGLSMLADGRIFAGGGGDGVNRTRVSLFNPSTSTWSRLADMPNAHWYGTAVAMPNGEVTISMGDSSNGKTDIYRNGTWQNLSGITMTGFGTTITDRYPFMHVSPRGTVFQSGIIPNMHELDIAGNGTTTSKGLRGTSEVLRNGGSGIMMDEGKLLITGGTPNQQGSLSSALIVDINSTNPVITALPNMTYSRSHHSVILLPNGEVLVMGGNGTGVEFTDDQSRLIPEIYNAATNTWRTASTMAVPRNYHSTATLLQDGRVLIAGGGLCGTCAANHQDGQIYSPSYLFKADGTLADRPVIGTTPSNVTYNQSFDLSLSGSGANSISKFYMVKFSATTHANNSDLRRVSVNFTKTATNTYRLSTHSNKNVVTPGYYYLFALSKDGVPSVAKIINIR